METIANAFEKSTITTENTTINLAGLGVSIFITGMIMVLIKVIF